ncbi:hypothetical protein YC2023_117448 [Brassica napus]
MSQFRATNFFPLRPRLACLLHHQASSASSTIKVLLHPPPSLTKNKQKSDSKRDKDRDRERYVEPWWSGGETASMTSNGETPKSNHAEER